MTKLTARTIINKAEALAKSNLTRVDGKFAALPDFPTKDAPPSVYFDFLMKSGGRTSPLQFIKDIRKQAIKSAIEAEQLLEDARDIANFFDSCARYIDGHSPLDEKPRYSITSPPPGFPPEVLAAVKVAKIYYQNGLISESDTIEELRDAGRLARAKISNAKQSFARFKPATLIAVNKQAAKYLERNGFHNEAKAYRSHAAKLIVNYRKRFKGHYEHRKEGVITV